MVFVLQTTAWFLLQGYRGGNINRGTGVTQPHSSISLIPLWLSPVNRPARFRRGRKAGTRATPPKPGGHAALDSGAVFHASIRPHGGSLSSSFIPAGRLETAPRSPPEGALKEGTQTLVWNKYIMRLVRLIIGVFKPTWMWASKGETRRALLAGQANIERIAELRDRLRDPLTARERDLTARELTRLEGELAKSLDGVSYLPLKGSKNGQKPSNWKKHSLRKRPEGRLRGRGK